MGSRQYAVDTFVQSMYDSGKIEEGFKPNRNTETVLRFFIVSPYKAISTDDQYLIRELIHINDSGKEVINDFFYFYNMARDTKTLIDGLKTRILKYTETGVLVITDQVTERSVWMFLGSIEIENSFVIFQIQ
jgi:hypothetical protein